MAFSSFPHLVLFYRDLRDESLQKKVNYQLSTMQNLHHENKLSLLEGC